MPERSLGDLIKTPISFLPFLGVLLIILGMGGSIPILDYSLPTENIYLRIVLALLGVALVFVPLLALLKGASAPEERILGLSERADFYKETADEAKNAASQKVELTSLRFELELDEVKRQSAEQVAESETEVAKLAERAESQSAKLAEMDSFLIGMITLANTESDLAQEDIASGLSRAFGDTLMALVSLKKTISSVSDDEMDSAFIDGFDTDAKPPENPSHAPSFLVGRLYSTVVTAYLRFYVSSHIFRQTISTFFGSDERDPLTFLNRAVDELSIEPYKQIMDASQHEPDFGTFLPSDEATNDEKLEEPED